MNTKVYDIFENIVIKMHVPARVSRPFQSHYEDPEAEHIANINYTFM